MSSSYPIALCILLNSQAAIIRIACRAQFTSEHAEVIGDASKIKLRIERDFLYPKFSIKLIRSPLSHFLNEYFTKIFDVIYHKKELNQVNKKRETT